MDLAAGRNMYLAGFRAVAQAADVEVCITLLDAPEAEHSIIVGDRARVRALDRDLRSTQSATE
jgi:hypothetical protein